MTREAVARALERADEPIVEAMNERATPGLGLGAVSGSGTVYAKGDRPPSPGVGEGGRLTRGPSTGSAPSPRR
jgi:hypothetical protein